MDTVVTTIGEPRRNVITGLAGAERIDDHRPGVRRGGAPTSQRRGDGPRSGSPHRPHADRWPWSSDYASSCWRRYAPWPPPRSLCATTPAAPAAPSHRRCLTMRGPIHPAARRGVTLHRPPQPKHRTPLPLHALTNVCVGDVEFQADHRDRPRVGEVRGLRPTPPTRHHHHLTTDSGRGVYGCGCHRGR